MRIAVVLAGVIVLGSSLGVAALGTGSAPSFARARNYATGSGPNSVAIGDLNGDRKPDLATANFGTEENAGKTLSVLLNRGNGSFRPQLDYGTGSRPVSVAIGDLNGDRKPDLVTANIEGSVSVLLNRGDGTFEANFDYANGRSPFRVAIGDLNGDRRRDIVTANADAPTVSVLLNKGDGSFRPKRDYRTGAGPSSFAIGDLNGDHKPDLATANSGATEEPFGSVSVLANRGDGSFRPKRDYATGDGPQSIAIGDLDGDHKPDLATANYTRTVSALVNTGDGSFQDKLDYVTGGHPYSIAIGDVNGDGKRDLATANSSANTVSVLLNRPGLCTVQNVRRQTLPAARRTIARANCRVGKIRRSYSKSIANGHVISQQPKFGTVLRTGGRVSLVVSRGRPS
jgi:FG-GAP-like repeat/PASTA domain/FG-GAP repeat